MKKFNAKGFTLAELLIVVAIIAVLVAVSIPVFTAQLEKSREETDIANLRSAYAIASTDALTEDYHNTTGTGAIYSVTSAGDVYYARYNIKAGKLVKSVTSDTTTGKGKGTSANGNCEDYEQPLVYSNATEASSNVIFVVIKDNTGGVAESVWAGFAAADESGFTGAKSDFDGAPS